MQNAHTTVFFFNVRSQEQIFEDQIAQIQIHKPENGVEIDRHAILENIIVFDCKKVLSKHGELSPKDFKEFEIYNCLALEMLEQIYLMQLRGRAVVVTLEELSLASRFQKVGLSASPRKILSNRGENLVPSPEARGCKLQLPGTRLV